jgi:deoxyadenosine/deoxycytidine kinase
VLIGVAGMVGAGKSTLARALGARFGLQLAPESVADNPWLAPYYAGGAASRRAYALRLQLHFLATRFESMRHIRGRGGGWVLDRTWYEDAEVFARGLWEDGVMDAQEWALYERLYGELLHSPAARPPRLLVYLHGPLDVIVGRIARRGRAGERETDAAYWAALHARYERWVAGFRRAPVLRCRRARLRPRGRPAGDRPGGGAGARPPRARAAAGGAVARGARRGGRGARLTRCCAVPTRACLTLRRRVGHPSGPSPAGTAARRARGRRRRPAARPRRARRPR